MAATDKLWYSMDVDKGFIVLPSDLHLGNTDPFPWDSSKGVYILNAYHGLHCLVRPVYRQSEQMMLIMIESYLYVLPDSSRTEKQPDPVVWTCNALP